MAGVHGTRRKQVSALLLASSPILLFISIPRPFLLLSFNPSRQKWMTVLLSLDLLQVSSTRKFFPAPAFCMLWEAVGFIFSFSSLFGKVLRDVQI